MKSQTTLLRGIEMKKRIAILLCVLMLFSSTFVLVSCKDDSFDKKGYDLSLPVLGEDGWYLVFQDDFDGDALNENIVFGENYNGKTEIWTTSPHSVRWESDDKNKPEQNVYWCPEAVSVSDGTMQIRSFYSSDHVCSDGLCPSQGRFTGGIETRALTEAGNDKGTSDELLFSQAFGYFEVRVKFPDATGLWSAFWLQSSNMRKTGAEGVDGTEIDVFESAFIKHPEKIGHALLWNGYGEYGQVDDFVTDTGKNLYDGYHTFALKWTPLYYVFYVDGQPTWASAAGGVSHVREFLRLTVEIDAGDGYGPHGQRIGKFDEESESVFYVDYVKVWQNSGYSQYEIPDECFAGELDMTN